MIPLERCRWWRRCSACRRATVIRGSPGRRKSRSNARSRSCSIRSWDWRGGEPLLVIYEDVHWLDPTTLELLDLLVDRTQRLPALVLMTFRPEFRPPWTGRAHVTQLSLSRLVRRHGSAMVARVTGGKPLPQEVLAQILERTDGVPLFVEEVTEGGARVRPAQRPR